MTRETAGKVITGRARPGSPGFTVLEVLIVLMIAGVIATAIFRSLGAQQRYSASKRSTVGQHDALRLAASVLTASLRGASAGEGDYVFVAADSIGVRLPTGFAIVCHVDADSRRLGLADTHGLVSAGEGDSVLVYTPAGWIARSVNALNPAGPEMPCQYSGLATQQTIKVDSAITAVPVGSPLRAFRQHVYRLELDANSWWLARYDGTESELLAGPFKGDGKKLSFSFLDASGQTTTEPTEVARVDLILVAEADNTSFAVDTVSLSRSVQN